GLPAVPKLLLAIDLRPPRTLPGVKATCWNSCAAWRTSGESNLIWCLTHWLYWSVPPYRMIRASNQSVAGQPVAAADSRPRHHGVTPLALIFSVRALSSSIVVGAVYPAASQAFFGYQTKLFTLALTSRP